MAKRHYNKNDIQSLIEQFESGKLPKTAWTHEAHLIVAVWYCITYGAAKALDIVRENVTRHNESVGTPNTDSGGYHETITIFWLWAVNQFIIKGSYDSVVHACNDLIDSEIGQNDYPLNYYSKAILFSAAARRYWIEPDLQKLNWR